MYEEKGLLFYKQNGIAMYHYFLFVVILCLDIKKIIEINIYKGLVHESYC